MAPKYALVIDATSGVVAQVNEKNYYGMTIYIPEVKTSPVPFLEIVTEQADHITIENCFSYFVRDSVNIHNEFKIPLLAVCDFCWPILNSLSRVFNKMELHTYLDYPHEVVLGTALELSVQPCHESFFTPVTKI